MTTLAIFKIALQSLRRTLLRSGLTTLGIIIGVAAVVAMISIGNGAKAKMLETIAQHDWNRFYLTAKIPEREGGPISTATTMPRGDGLTQGDYRAIRQDIRGLVGASPELSASAGRAIAYGRSSEANLVGIDVEGFELLKRKPVQGTTFGAIDVERASSVCIITDFLARRLFPGREPIGHLIRVKGIPLRVIGVVADSSYGDPAQANLGDAEIFVPFTSLLMRIDRSVAMSIMLKADSPESWTRVKSDVMALMEQRRGTRKAEFSMFTAAEMVQLYDENSRTMTLLLATIAGISLLVGGIGIMNIMLVNVTERTREIGLRMAIGTRGRDVLRQFLIEAMTLSLLGGAIGIVLGATGARVITYLNAWPTQVTLGSILGAFLCSAAIGIFFGYYPARQASRLDPIEALRTE